VLPVWPLHTGESVLEIGVAILSNAAVAVAQLVEPLVVVQVVVGSSPIRHLSRARGRASLGLVRVGLTSIAPRVLRRGATLWRSRSSPFRVTRGHRFDTLPLSASATAGPGPSMSGVDIAPVSDRAPRYRVATTVVTIPDHRRHGFATTSPSARATAAPDPATSFCVEVRGQAVPVLARYGSKVRYPTEIERRRRDVRRLPAP
jgi:hypothetical protein